MIGWLIRLVGTSAARHIDRGSPTGALVGALACAAVGVGAAYGLYRLEAFDRGWAGPAVTLGLFGALAGAFIGSRFRLDGVGTPAEPWNATVGDATVVRLTNFNHALAPIAVFAALAALGVALLVVPASPAKPPRPGEAAAEPEGFDLRLFLVPVAFVAAGVALVRAVLWVDVGRELRVRRLLGTRSYRAADLADWGFAVGERVPTRQPPAAERATAVFLLPGRGLVRVPVAPAAARRVADVLARHHQG
ncbi:MAG: hypothetical protein JWO31_3464 [Phycisphaerales bacterium]|nr:hypothetical protein [Phycisphaerales bacterium]